jgi:hypothetical protein
MTPIDDELRRTLDARAAAMAPPTDPLAGVESRAHGIQRRRQALAGGGVAAVVLAVAVAVPLATRADRSPSRVAGQPTAIISVGPDEEPTPAPTPSPTGVPTPTSATTPATSAPPAGAVAKAIYYVGDSDGRALLYREFRRLEHPTPSNVLRTMFTTPAADPDYTSLWPTGSEATLGPADGDQIAIDLNDAAVSGTAGSEFACLSLQQLVWTATAAMPEFKRILVTHNGKADGVVSQWWGVGCGKDEPIARHAPSYEILAPVQISNPVEGTTVRPTFVFGGEATVFEANVSWSVVDKASGKVLKEGFSTATAGAPARGSWTANVALTGVTPGQLLELRAWESSAKDGSVTFLDTKTVTVAS